MASVAKLYQQEMHNNLGFFANWFPGDTLEIGDVGTLENGRFRRVTTLKSLGVESQVSMGHTTQNLQYTSTSGTTITASANASPLSAVAKGEIKIDFSREGAFVFNASGLTMHRLENRSQIAEEVLKIYAQDRWEKDWLLIESLYEAKRTTVIVSEDSSAGLVLQASAEIGIPSASLADPKVDLKMTATRGKMVQVVGGKNMHPLYSCLRIKDSWFSSQPSLQPIRGQQGLVDMPFDRVGILELLNS
ncbi:hypothetical protein GO988_23530 [Hymenobacter sp. HMF4947]|uniref:Uncharacterized protein n=1 Tax=Hymenobacter ginkgonis TaxID=2682976 RepID=A0A7K1TLN6_9BACT|nr:hypothetical protein [Hymenobacter ginkgonis]MVN79315.1 hypothetical protein [Hymenobacter ginkgonis]